MYENIIKVFVFRRPIDLTADCTDWGHSINIVSSTSRFIAQHQSCPFRWKKSAASR